MRRFFGDMLYMLSRNNYTLLQKLGKGGYAEVYKCTSVSGQHYACKVVEKQSYNYQRIMKEISIHSHMRPSRHVARLVDTCEDTRSYVMVMELCEEGHVNINRVHGEDETKRVIKNTLEGLVDIHSRGVVHKDIKHANLMLHPDGVKIVDFGASVYLDTIKDSMVCPDIRGTPWYMSPEVFEYQCSYATDVWSVGVLAYHMMSGKFPFDDRGNSTNPSMNRIIRSIMQDTPLFEDSVWEDVSKTAVEFIMECLAKPPQERPTAADCLKHPWFANMLPQI